MKKIILPAVLCLLLFTGCKKIIDVIHPPGNNTCKDCRLEKMITRNEVIVEDIDGTVHNDMFYDTVKYSYNNAGLPISAIGKRYYGMGEVPYFANYDDKGRIVEFMEETTRDHSSAMRWDLLQYVNDSTAKVLQYSYQSAKEINGKKYPVIYDPSHWDDADMNIDYLFRFTYVFDSKQRVIKMAPWNTKPGHFPNPYEKDGNLESSLVRYTNYLNPDTYLEMYAGNNFSKNFYTSAGGWERTVEASNKCNYPIHLKAPLTKVTYIYNRD